MIIPIISSVFIVIALALLFNLTPERVTDDLIRLISPNDTLREESRAVRGNRKRHRLYYALVGLKTELSATGKGKRFAFVCFASITLFAVGCAASAFMGNMFLLPALSAAFALLPFVYVRRTLAYYDRQTKEELETTMSIITTAYIRSDDILLAVKENLQYIKPPLCEIFKAFEGDASAVSSNVKRALLNLREKIDNEIFREWADALILCQDDRTLKDTLLPIVSKLTDVRIVNSELKTMLASARNEYWFMVALVLGNIPLLYVLNRDWFATLMYTAAGKAVLGICGAVILITALLMFRFTKPIEYKR